MRRWWRQKIRECRDKTTQPTLAPPADTQMIVPRGIATYPYFPKRRFPITMSATTAMTTTKKRVKSHKGHYAKYTPPTLATPFGRQIMAPRGITIYQYLPDRLLTMTTSTTTMTMNNMWKLHKGHPTHTRSSWQEADDSSKSYYDRPIHSQKWFPTTMTATMKTTNKTKKSMKGTSWS